MDFLFVLWFGTLGQIAAKEKSIDLVRLNPKKKGLQLRILSKSNYRNIHSYCNLWAAVTSTFGAINDAPPMKVPLWKMRQAWGHSPS